MSQRATALLVLLCSASTLLAAPQSVQPLTLDLEALHWRSIGPAIMGGRTTSIVGIPGEPPTIYLGTALGGIYKSVDAGTTWKHLFTKESVASIGAIAIAPSNPQIVWTGTGEANTRNDVSYGNGVYRSDDGGLTWRHLGLPSSRHIPRIVVHPSNPDVVYVAALGSLSAPNRERGVFRTDDGGRTWENVLFVNEDTGASDLVMDPIDPRVLYAGLWQVRRFPWHFSSGGKSGGIYKSTDGGDHWTKLSSGLPVLAGRIGLGISPTHPKIVYALVESREGVLYRSENAGETWRMINDTHEVNQRPFYFSQVVVSPSDPNEIYSLSRALLKSVDGGRSFKPIARRVHGDHQSLWIDPGDPARMLDANDGGAATSNDGGRTWMTLNTVPLGQFYRISVDARTPYQVCGGLQDNGIWCGPSRTRRALGILDRDWEMVLGGDGQYVLPLPHDPDTLFADSQNGNLHRVDRRTGQTRNVQPYPRFVWGWPSVDVEYRFNWTSPVALSPHDPDVVYLGGNVLFMTSDAGSTWTKISPDLTRDDPSKQQLSGGPITTEMGPDVHYNTIYAVEESSLMKGLIWVGTDDGLIQITRDGGAHWTNTSAGLRDLQPWSVITSISASRFDAGRAYITADRHLQDDFEPYVYRTTDFGETWTRIVHGLPKEGHAHVVREDPFQPGLLYLGTETGIWVSFDDGYNWRSLNLNLPTTSVRDIVVHPTTGDLVIGTHGLSVWIMDDPTPLRALAAGPLQTTTLMEPRPAWRFRPRMDVRALGDRPFVGENPPYGAVFHYFLQGTQSERVTFTVRDESGAPVRAFHEEVSPGFNRAVWDLRHDGPDLDEGINRRTGQMMRGPLATPGTYEVTMTVGDAEHRKSLTVKPDAPMSASIADLEKQLELLMRLGDAATTMDKAIARAGDVRRQLQSARRSLEAKGDTRLVDSAHDIDRRLASIESRLYGTEFTNLADFLRYPVRLRERLLMLARWIDSADAAPTRAEVEQSDLLLNELDDLLGELEEIFNVAVPEFNERSNRVGVEPIVTEEQRR